MTTSLTVTYPIVVYERDFSNSPFDTLSVDDKIKATIQKRKRSQARLDSAVAKISRMTASINKHTEESAAALHGLMIEIQHLEEEQRAQILANQPKLSSEEEHRAEADLEFEFDQYDRDQQRKEAEEAIRNFNEMFSMPAKDARVKKLYRKISMRTHPDRTKDTEKHKLFVAAKQYYADNNLEGLENIWQILNGKVSSLFDRLYKRLHEELMQLELVEKILNSTLSSEDYELAQLFEKNSFIVLEQIEKKLQFQIIVLRSQRNNLREALGKPDVCATSSFANFEF
jgi:hypothetical protein